MYVTFFLVAFSSDELVTVIDHQSAINAFKSLILKFFVKLKDTIQVPNNTTNAGEVQSYPLIHFKMPYKDVKLWG